MMLFSKSHTMKVLTTIQPQKSSHPIKTHNHLYHHCLQCKIFITFSENIVHRTCSRLSVAVIQFKCHISGQLCFHLFQHKLISYSEWYFNLKGILCVTNMYKKLYWKHRMLIHADRMIIQERLCVMGCDLIVIHLHNVLQCTM